MNYMRVAHNSIISGISTLVLRLLSSPCSLVACKLEGCQLNPSMGNIILQAFLTFSECIECSEGVESLSKPEDLKNSREAS